MSEFRENNEPNIIYVDFSAQGGTKLNTVQNLELMSNKDDLDKEIESIFVDDEQKSRSDFGLKSLFNGLISIIKSGIRLLQSIKSKLVLTNYANQVLLIRQYRKKFFKSAKNKVSEVENNNKAKKSVNGRIWLALMAVGIILFTLYSAGFKNTYSNNVNPSQKNISSQLSAQSNYKDQAIFLDPLVDKNETIKIATIAPKTKMVITTGTFKSISQAEAYMPTIREVTEQKLKVLNKGKFFTIQIGPVYIEDDSAMFVFNELYKFNLNDLMIQTL
jgi:hypothetical protein